MATIAQSQITLYDVYDGQNGDQGLQGVPGKDGQSLYTWLKYSDSPTTGMSEYPEGKTYIGLAYNMTTPTESNNYADYNWSLIQGEAGMTGADGKTYYTWIKYATTPTSGISDDPTGKIYMGIAYNKLTATESTNYADYSWSLIKGDKGDKGDVGEQGLQGLQGNTGATGIQGATGANGLTSYTHIAYATNATGTTGFSVSDPVGKTYIGMYTDFTALDSTDPTKYKWTLIKGADGSQGIAGPKGTDGQTPYLHIAYATNATGSTGFSTTDSVGKTYIGQYTDFVAADSNSASAYSWTLIKGDKGDKGDTGSQGLQGLQGVKGDQGIAGATGANGLTSYTHIAYANNSVGTTGFSVSDSAGKLYIGMYTDFTATDSTDPSKYKWTLIKGADGSQGIQGTPGANGQTPYLHIAYATNATGSTGFSTTDAVGKTYIGTYTDFVAADSNTASLYTWSLIKGDKGDTGSPGAKGADGVTTYTWVKYADDKLGAGMSDLPEGKRFMGLAMNKTTAIESATASDYNWSPLYDNVVVGGRNFLRNSGNFTDTTFWGQYTAAYPITNIAVATDPIYGTVITATGDNSLARLKLGGNHSMEGKNRKFTFSMIYSQTGTDAVTFGGKYSTLATGGSEYGAFTGSNYVYEDLGNGFKKMTCQLDLTYTAGYEGFFCYIYTRINTVKVAYCKLDEGNIATGWTSAPEDNKGLYTWIRYATSITGTGISTDPNGKDYIGIAYNKDTATASNTPADYTWSLFRGATGIQGPAGPQGNPGVQGLQGVKGDQGIQGAVGANGLSSYTHIAYATNATGTTGFSVSDPVGKTYMGIYVDNSATDSTNPYSYKWTLIKGADGSQGTPGATGANGQTPYFHVAYATNATGTAGFSTTVSTAKTYIGTYTDFLSADSTDPTKYKWALIKGDTGATGPTGSTGATGPQGPIGPNIVNSTTVIEADVVKANHIDVSNLSAISANLGTITAGVVNGVTMNSANMNLLNGGNFIAQNVETGGINNFEIATGLFKRAVGNGQAFFGFLDGDVDAYKGMIGSYSQGGIGFFSGSIDASGNFVPSVGSKLTAGSYSLAGNRTVPVLESLGTDVNGDYVRFGGGGAMLIGAGESIYAFATEFPTLTTESNFITADSYTKILTNMQTGYAARHEWMYGTDGWFYKARDKEPNGYNSASIYSASVHDDYMLIQDKKVAITVSGTGYIDVTYPTAFNAVPEWVIVSGVDGNSSAYSFAVYNITATTCRVYATHLHNVSTSYTTNFQMVACGRKRK